MMDAILNALQVETRTEAIWVMVGLFGQLMFTARFLIQWISSEMARKSIVPLAFWYFSICGSAILLSYAIYRMDPVFILGQSMGFVIYIRNIWLIHAERRHNAQA